MLRTQRLEACAQHVSRSGPGRSRRRLGRGGSPPQSRAARADRSDRPRRTSVRESDDGPRVVQDRPAREVAAVVAGQDREARVAPTGRTAARPPCRGAGSTEPSRRGRGRESSRASERLLRRHGREAMWRRGAGRQWSVVGTNVFTAECQRGGAPSARHSRLRAGRLDRSGGGLRLAVVPVLAGVPSNGRNRGHASWAERDGGVRRAPRAGWSGLRRSGLALDLAQGLGHGKTAQQPRPVWGVARFRDQACRIAAHAEARSSGKGDPPTATQSPTVMGVSLERTETTAGGPGNDAEPANRSACLNHIN